MTKFLALIAVAALMVSASDPAFAGRRHRNCGHQGHHHRAQSWSGQQQYGNGQGYFSNNSGYQNSSSCCQGGQSAGYSTQGGGYNTQGGGYNTQGQTGVFNGGQNAPAPVTTGYPPSESSLDTNINSTTRTNGADVNINSSTRGNVTPSGAAARQNVDVQTAEPQQNP